MSRRQPSLKWPLILQPLIYHLFTLIIAFIVLIALLVRADSGGQYTDQTLAKVAAEAVVRKADGSLAIRMTPELAKAREELRTTWFVAEDEKGRSVSFGQVPAAYSSLAGHLGDIAFGDMRGRAAPYTLSIVVRQESGPAGKLAVLAHGKLATLTLIVGLTANLLVIPIFALLALVTVILIPLIVKRSLAGVARIASEAEQIDVNRRGIRLTETEVPKEIGPLVRAVNDALARLDEGYERQHRFLAAAAHELRTPIAILRVKLDSADPEIAARLSGDVARLSTLAEQLLDLHRIGGEALTERIDLAVLVRRVAADLAPLLIAAGKTIEVGVERTDPISGNVGAIERVVTNLVQNAVEHGGRNVMIRAYDSIFEVEDDGPGVPPDERERVFEAFQRVRPRPTGAGLGLNLVQQAVERHGGKVTILDAPDGGALFRVVFPKA